MVNLSCPQKRRQIFFDDFKCERCHWENDKFPNVELVCVLFFSCEFICPPELDLVPFPGGGKHVGCQHHKVNANVFPVSSLLF